MKDIFCTVFDFDYEPRESLLVNYLRLAIQLGAMFGTNSGFVSVVSPRSASFIDSTPSLPVPIWLMLLLVSASVGPPSIFVRYEIEDSFLSRKMDLPVKN